MNNFKKYYYTTEYYVSRIIKLMGDSVFGNRAMLKYQFFNKSVAYNPKVQCVDESQFKGPDTLRVKNGLKKLYSFLELHKNKENVFLLFAPCPFDSVNGQRSVRFAQELALKKILVIYVRCLPNNIPEKIRIHENNIIEIPFNWFFPSYKKILTSPFLSNKKATVLFQMVFSQAMEIQSFLNARQWFSIYDLIDNWEEFSKDKYISKYSLDDEEQLIRKSDLVFTINQTIRGKFSHIKDITIVPNGFSPWILAGNAALDKKWKAPRTRKAKYIIGTFGYLHIFRFNWELLINVARRHPEWTFEVIGYGQPYFLLLPSNVKLIGTVDSERLHLYAQRWNAAIVPYHNNALCQNLNPIKVFEFLFFKLPVVVHGCGDLQNYPYVSLTNDESEFEKAIANAVITKTDPEVIEPFLSQTTWEHRVNQILDQMEVERKVASISQNLEEQSIA